MEFGMKRLVDVTTVKGKGREQDGAEGASLGCGANPAEGLPPSREGALKRAAQLLPSRKSQALVWPYYVIGWGPPEEEQDLG